MNNIKLHDEYVTVDKNDNLDSITYFIKNNKRSKQIDLQVAHNGILPHVHHGYNHNENDSEKGYSNLTLKEKKMVERVNRIWYNHKHK